MSADSNHFRPSAITISSRPTIEIPNITGKATKQVNRNILRNTRACRSTSSAVATKSGCTTPFTSPVTTECPMKFHLLAWV